MSRIICVSNRVSLPDPETGEIKAGGLAVGVKAALESNGGGIWFGWDGNTIENCQSRQLSKTQLNNLTFLTLPLTKKEYQDYYKGMANQNLWPLMHELGNHLDPMQDVYETYKDVNRLFARQLIEHIEPGDIIWVHDYHLIPLGKELRALNVENKIAFYNHIPMPSRQFLESAAVPAFLKEQYQILQSDLFYYDQVGFQSYRDYRNFTQACSLSSDRPERFCSRRVDGSPTKFGVFPISIETDTIRQNLAKTTYKPGSSKKYKTLFGAERLDYTKGLWHRMQGYYKFLQQHPELQKQVRYKQITPLSRSDIKQYKKTIQRTRKVVNKIRQRFSNSHWNPIEYSEDGMPRDKLLSQMAVADIGLVTPLIDGQNLVAKEFLAVQNTDNPGTLILSETAGAAEELGNLGVLCVDPENTEDIADKIYQAYTMPKEKRLETHYNCLSHLSKFDINYWTNAFITQLNSNDIDLDNSNFDKAA